MDLSNILWGRHEGRKGRDNWEDPEELEDREDREEYPEEEELPPVNVPNYDVIRATVDAASAAPGEVSEPTAPLFAREGVVPPVGWLVCTKGPDRGRDYRIVSGYNYIGRGEDMDIRITGDPHISREKHALLAYDPVEGGFFFGPADGKSILRLNGKMIMTPAPLSAYDILTCGETELLFMPLCGERFNWNDE